MGVDHGLLWYDKEMSWAFDVWAIIPLRSALSGYRSPHALRWTIEYRYLVCADELATDYVPLL